MAHWCCRCDKQADVLRVVRYDGVVQQVLPLCEEHAKWWEEVYEKERADGVLSVLWSYKDYRPDQYGEILQMLQNEEVN